MTFDDGAVILVGTIALLVTFLVARVVFLSRTVDVWAIVRHYFAVRVVSNYQERAPHVMSRSDDDDAPSRPSSPQTDGVQTDRQPAPAVPGRAELLTLYSTMRAAGISREKARTALKAVGLPLDNNLWAEALPAAPADESYVTPIVGRPTSARFETDPELAYQAPAH